jgi:hypothetical protein
MEDEKCVKYNDYVAFIIDRECNERNISLILCILEIGRFLFNCICIEYNHDLQTKIYNITDIHYYNGATSMMPSRLKCIFSNQNISWNICFNQL